MRLWSIHPKYLDSQGLLGLWRESLLAQKVLLGQTVGYKNHPQLIRFKNTKDPILYIGTYLYYVYVEGESRGYNFDKNKIIKYDLTVRMPVTKGQIQYEFQHLLEKLRVRDSSKYEEVKDEIIIETNPIFYVTDGDVEKWEKIKSNLRITV